MIENLKKEHEKLKKRLMTYDELKKLQAYVEDAKSSIWMAIDYYGSTWCGKVTGEEKQRLTNFKNDKSKRDSWKINQVIQVYEKLLKAIKELDK